MNKTNTNTNASAATTAQTKAKAKITAAFDHLSEVENAIARARRARKAGRPYRPKTKREYNAYWGIK